MRVDVDSRSFGLFEQSLEIFQIVTGNQYRLALDRLDPHGCRLGTTVSADVALVEQPHNLEVDLAALKGHGDQFVHRGIVFR